MILQSRTSKRKGSVLVEYALLIAGIVLVSTVAIGVLGHKVMSNFAVIAAIIPGAHADDNKPVAHAEMIPFVDDGTGKLVLDTNNLVNQQGGVDRMSTVLGAGKGELLIVE
jgi:pilus assembly protein Flp/PilA